MNKKIDIKYIKIVAARKMEMRNSKWGQKDNGRGTLHRSVAEKCPELRNVINSAVLP